MLRSALFALPVCLMFGTLACGQSHNAPSNADSGAAGTTASASGGAAGSAPAAGGMNDQASGGTASAGMASSLGGTSAAGSAPGGTSSSGGSGGQTTTESVSLLVFSKTAAYRHESIPAGVQALTKLASEHGWQLSATEDASTFTDAGLAKYNAVIFLSTTGDVLDDTQQAAFERFIRKGNGFIGIHSATDTEYDWAWYGGLVGAYFREHPAIQAADVVVEDAQNPATASLQNPWHRTDEWYAFQSNPRANVHVVLSLDEHSYNAGTANMNGDHPIAWYHDYDGGRAFYTALGHTNESFSDPAFLAHLTGAITWATTH